MYIYIKLHQLLLNSHSHLDVTKRTKLRFFLENLNLQHLISVIHTLNNILFIIINKTYQNDITRYSFNSELANIIFRQCAYLDLMQMSHY